MGLKWGIIGLGSIANKFANDLQLVDGVELVGVASRNQQKAEEFKIAHNAKHAFGSYLELFQSKEIDIVYIATPHSSHMNWSVEAMKHGKHVLCEKPLAVNETQVQKMIDVATENKVFLMEALWTRFNPSLVKVLKHIEVGEIGNVSYVNADFCFFREAPDDSRLINMDLAGGSLLDIGIYPLFLAYVIFGMPKEIKASARLHRTGADLQTTMALKFDQGMASLSCGFASNSDMVAKIHGTTGSIFIDAPWHHSDSYKIIQNEKSTVYSNPTKGRGFTYEIEECVSCIAQSKISSALWSHQDSLNLVRITDEIRAQIEVKYPFE